jgi:hypothetical protein
MVRVAVIAQVDAQHVEAFRQQSRRGGNHVRRSARAFPAVQQDNEGIARFRCAIELGHEPGTVGGLQYQRLGRQPPLDTTGAQLARPLAVEHRLQVRVTQVARWYELRMPVQVGWFPAADGRRTLSAPTGDCQTVARPSGGELVEFDGSVRRRGPRAVLVQPAENHGVKRREQ